jgi:hypothetical protein
MSAVLSAILGLYVGHAEALDAVSMQLAQEEMRRLLVPAGYELVSNAHGASVSHALVGAFDGSCSIESLPSFKFPDSGRNILADTSVSTTRVLPYFRVDCNRLIWTLAPTLQPLSMPLRRVVFGRALGRVMAHEAYHILAQSKGHDGQGAARASFSLEDLTAVRFEFEAATLERMRPLPLLAGTH